VGELRRRPLHAEMRGVLLAAHREFKEEDIQQEINLDRSRLDLLCAGDWGGDQHPDNTTP